MNDIWARAIEVAVGITLLGIQLGATCIVPLLLTLGQLQAEYTLPMEQYSTYSSI